MKIIFEACVDSLEAALAAQEGGADRVELCVNLPEGGVTPSAGLTDMVCSLLKIPVMVIVRPRGGDFLYSDSEFQLMKKEIEFIKTKKARGVVSGILNADGTIDKERTKELIDIARPLEFTFHRAFDMTRDPFEALDVLIELGADRVLTSGQEITAHAGIVLIQKLAEKAGSRISIMPGSGINERNAVEIINRCGVKEIHSSARVKKRSKMLFKNEKTYMSGTQEISEYEIMTASADKVRAIKQTIEQAP
jgi:copper homeostasis protein